MSCMPISSKTYAARLPIVVYNRCCGRISRSRIRTPWTCCPATSRCSTGCMSRISTKARSQTIASQGRRQFVCPAVRAWSRFFPDYDGAWLNTYRMAVAGLKYGAEGMVVTDWGDYGHVNDPRLSVPGLCYGAQNAWNPVAIDACEMNHRISNLAYGDESGCLWIHSLASTPMECRSPGTSPCKCWTGIRFRHRHAEYGGARMWNGRAGRAHV